MPGGSPTGFELCLHTSVPDSQATRGEHSHLPTRPACKPALCRRRALGLRIYRWQMASGKCDGDPSHGAARPGVSLLLKFCSGSSYPQSLLPDESTSFGCRAKLPRANAQSWCAAPESICVRDNQTASDANTHTCYLAELLCKLSGSESCKETPAGASPFLRTRCVPLFPMLVHKSGPAEAHNQEATRIDLEPFNGPRSDVPRLPHDSPPHWKRSAAAATARPRPAGPPSTPRPEAAHRHRWRLRRCPRRPGGKGERARRKRVAATPRRRYVVSSTRVGASGARPAVGRAAPSIRHMWHIRFHIHTGRPTCGKSHRFLARQARAQRHRFSPRGWPFGA